MEYNKARPLDAKTSDGPGRFATYRGILVSVLVTIAMQYILYIPLYYHVIKLQMCFRQFVTLKKSVIIS